MVLLLLTMHSILRPRLYSNRVSDEKNNLLRPRLYSNRVSDEKNNFPGFQYASQYSASWNFARLYTIVTSLQVHKQNLWRFN